MQYFCIIQKSTDYKAPHLYWVISCEVNQFFSKFLLPVPVSELNDILAQFESSMNFEESKKICKIGNIHSFESKLLCSFAFLSVNICISDFVSFFDDDVVHHRRYSFSSMCSTTQSALCFHVPLNDLVAEIMVANDFIN